MNLVVVLITIVATIDVMIAIGMTVGKIDTVGTVPDHLLAAALNLRIVDPGLRPPGGRILIEGLQGTMITGEEAMMTADPLIIIMTAAGMT